MNNRCTPTITITTSAYNVEEYIEQCAQSVLNQSFTDFEWIILDNGCTDRTSAILQTYADKDIRIKIFRNEKNSVVYNVPHNISYIQYINNLQSEYWCTLDSDDYLHEDFLLELYTAGKRHDADIVVGGTEMFLEENPSQRGTRCPPDYAAQDITCLGDMFPKIYGSFRPIWGKLFKVSIRNLRVQYRAQHQVNAKNAGDTIFCMDCLKFSKSVTFVSKVLHYYRIRKGSLYHSQVDINRYLDYVTIYQESNRLLQQWDKLNDENLNFISEVLYHSIKDCMEIAANAKNVSIEKRLEVIETIISDQVVYEIFEKGNLLDELFSCTQSVIKRISAKAEDSDLPGIMNSYIYRLFRAIEMGTSIASNKQNAFLLYVGAVYDQNNNNHFGANLLYDFLGLVGKDNIRELEGAGINSKILVSNSILLRELVNSDLNKAMEMLEASKDNIDLSLVKEILLRISTLVDKSWIENAKVLIDQYVSSENFAGGIELLLEVLNLCPLDKEALCYKLYLLTINGDVITALETAEALRIFYSNDSIVSILAAQAYVNVQNKEKAADILQKALEYCVDETQRDEIEKELEAICL